MNVIQCNKCGRRFTDCISKGQRRIPDMEFWMNDYSGGACTSYRIKDIALCEDCTEDFLQFIKQEGSE